MNLMISWLGSDWCCSGQSIDEGCSGAWSFPAELLRSAYFVLLNGSL